MRKNIILLTALTILVFFLNRSFAQSNNEPFENFNKIIGQEKAEVLKKAVKSFDEFLLLNFSYCSDQNLRIIEFLRNMRYDNYDSNKKWIFNYEFNKEIIDDFEESGLRKEIWMYGYENREIEEESQEYLKKFQDSINAMSDCKILTSDLIFEEETLLSINDSLFKEQLRKDSIRYSSQEIPTFYSNIVIAMQRSKSKDSLLLNYINTKLIVGCISPNSLVDGLLYKHEKNNYDDPLIKIVVITEFYYYLMKSNIETVENRN